MERVAGAGSFLVSGKAYDDFMGRYSGPLAAQFASYAEVTEGQRVLDVGCGPGALTGELIRRLGAEQVSACDPSAPFVAVCRARNPGIDVRHGSAEVIPFEDGTFDVVASQLVMHFVSDPSTAATEMKRVLRPLGTIAACVWDHGNEMRMLRYFWDAALTVDPQAPDEHRALRFGQAGELSEWLTAAGFGDVGESTLTVSSTYSDFDELWSGFLAGIGPAGSYCVNLPAAHRASLRQALHERLGEPTGAFSLEGVARAGRARLH